MRTRTTKLLLALLAGVVLVAGAFVFSAAVWGPWWRFANMPTAEEWSALFGASALAALGFAWYQIRQVDRSNRDLVVSNARSREVAIESVRPRVQVSLQLDRVIRKQRGQAAAGTIYVAVTNIGKSPALDVRLTVDVPFTSLESFFQPGRMLSHFEEVNSIFDGSVHFSVLDPGKTYIWFLGRSPELFEDASGIPRRWQVRANYGSTVTPMRFDSDFLVDLDVEKQQFLPIDPLGRIGKDIEVVGEILKSIAKSIPDELSLDEDVIRALRRSSPVTRTRGRRTPSWSRRR